MESGCEHCARRVENKRCDEDRADHDAEEPERGQTRQPRDQQADHARDFEGGDQVSEPLTHADRGEHLHLGLVPGELGGRGHYEARGQQDLCHPQGDVHTSPAGLRRRGQDVVSAHRDVRMCGVQPVRRACRPSADDPGVHALVLEKEAITS